MTLSQFESLKAWHQGHWRRQPVEKHAWDMVLTFWLAGLVRCDWTVALDR